MGSLVVALASVGLFVISRGKWSDAIIDTGTEWMYAAELSRGALLYRDVIYWFGPLTPYFLAAFLRLFGPSFSSLVLAGLAGSVAALAALFYALRAATGRREAFLWTALAVAVLVFMPHSGGSILGMGYRIWHPATFTLLALAVACRPASRRPTGSAAAAGVLCALAGLSRTEWGLMAFAGVLTAFFLARPRRWLRDGLLAAAVSLTIFFSVLGVFVALAGKQAVLRDAHILLGGISPETRRFLLAFSGIPDWRRGLVQLVYSAAMWSGAVLLVHGAALGWKFSERRDVRRALLLLGVLLLGSALGGGSSGAVFFSAAPLVCLASLLAGWMRRGRPMGAALASFGLVGLIASHRRPFHIGDSAYVAPPLLFAFVASAALLWLLVCRQARSGPRTKLRSALSVAVAGVVVFAFAGRAAQYATDERIPVPGTGGALRANRRTVDEIVATAQAVRDATRAGDGLVVFPEGQVLNALSDRRNPLRQKLYIPGYLTSENEPALLADLERNRPRAIVIWPRSTTEYGPGVFGIDYGLRIRAWIDAEYVFQPFRAPGGPSRSHARFLLGLRKARQ